MRRFLVRLLDFDIHFDCYIHLMLFWQVYLACFVLFNSKVIYHFHQKKTFLLQIFCFVQAEPWTLLGNGNLWFSLSLSHLSVWWLSEPSVWMTNESSQGWYINQTAIVSCWCSSRTNLLFLYKPKKMMFEARRIDCNATLHYITFHRFKMSLSGKCFRIRRYWFDSTR